jgi:hypothetical protein
MQQLHAVAEGRSRRTRVDRLLVGGDTVSARLQDASGWIIGTHSHSTSFSTKKAALPLMLHSALVELESA